MRLPLGKIGDSFGLNTKPGFFNLNRSNKRGPKGFVACFFHIAKLKNSRVVNWLEDLLDDRLLITTSDHN